MGHFRIEWLNKYGNFPNNPHKTTGIIKDELFLFFNVTRTLYIFEIPTSGYILSEFFPEGVDNMDREKAEKIIRKLYKQYEENQRRSFVRHK